MRVPYSLTITSCSRHDLLQRTLISFYSTVDELPMHTYIYEDGPTERPNWLPDEVHWIQGGERKGQLHAIDHLYRHVKTPHIFHLEDDWMFNPGSRVSHYIERSRNILDHWPQVIMVSLRGESGWHPLVTGPSYPFKIARPNWDGWGGCSFNPGLRRLADWKKIGSYSQHATHDVGAEHERKLSRLYLEMGYVIADLGERIVEHIGDGRSVLDDFTRTRRSRDVRPS